MEKIFNIKEWENIPSPPATPGWVNKTYDYEDPDEQNPRPSEPSQIEGLCYSDYLHYSVTNRPLIETLDNTLVNHLNLLSLTVPLKGFIRGFERIDESGLTGSQLVFTRGIYILNEKIVNYEKRIYKGKIEDLEGNITVDFGESGTSLTPNSVYYIQVDNNGNFYANDAENENLLTVGKIETDGSGNFDVSSWEDKRSFIGDNLDKTDTDEILNKFISNAIAKDWEDRITANANKIEDIDTHTIKADVVITTQQEFEYWFGTGNETGTGTTEGGWAYTEVEGNVLVTIPQNITIYIRKDPSDGTTVLDNDNNDLCGVKAYSLKTRVKISSGVRIDGDGIDQTVIILANNYAKFITDYVVYNCS